MFGRYGILQMLSGALLAAFLLLSSCGGQQVDQSVKNEVNTLVGKWTALGKDLGALQRRCTRYVPIAERAPRHLPGLLNEAEADSSTRALFDSLSTHYTQAAADIERFCKEVSTTKQSVQASRQQFNQFHQRILQDAIANAEAEQELTRYQAIYQDLDSTHLALQAQWTQQAAVYNRYTSALTDRYPAFKGQTVQPR